MTIQPMPHQSGFVSIVGKPNVGKSSLMNRFTGQNTSMTTPKAQTTRHRIMGIINGEDYQIVYSDTPGILEPKYALHRAMMNFVRVSLEDADIVALVTDATASWAEEDALMAPFQRMTTPLVVLVNKIDLLAPEMKAKTLEDWRCRIPHAHAVLLVSAKTGEGVPDILRMLRELLPVHPPYFDKEMWTDRTERFFASEIIRAQIFLHYEQEIPYSTEVSIESFKEEEHMFRIQAIIYVERHSQKGIIIGKGGSALKKMATQARLGLEDFFEKKVFLETRVKVSENWRKEKHRLSQFGYHT